MGVNDSILMILYSVSLGPGDPVWHRFATRRNSVADALSAELDVYQVKAMGSFARGSAIRGTSDLDLLVVLRKAEVTLGTSVLSSTTVLNKVRASLLARYPRTEVGRDGPAVTIRFAAGEERVDVVPAWFHRFGDHGRPVYAMPDGTGGWMETSPDIHGEFIGAADAATGGQLKGVAKLLKLWRQANDVSLSSFHLELLLAGNNVGLGVVSYADCLEHAFRLLHSRNCRALRDPCGIAGNVAAASSDAQLSRLIAAVAKAVESINLANRLDFLGQQELAAEVWQNLLLGRR